MSRSVIKPFSSLPISLDEFDDISDSGSDYEVTINSKKRKNQAVPRPQVNYFILFWINSLSFRCQSPHLGGKTEQSFCQIIEVFMVFNLLILFDNHFCYCEIKEEEI